MVISVFFLGMALGQMLYGPFSDSFGRKKAIYLGVSIFILGSMVSLLSTNFTFMLIGRVGQGFGICSCRVVSLAMIRDKLSGREMARVMSLIMVLFIMVPAIAPSLGQVILFYTDWRAIFLLNVGIGLIAMVWLYCRLPETLAKERRLAFSVATITTGIAETFRNPISRSGRDYFRGVHWLSQLRPADSAVSVQTWRRLLPLFWRSGGGHRLFVFPYL
jgi:MFS transporter, DHA1 family, multidrug resistance protein